MKTIGIDFDDVIARTYQFKTTYVNKFRSSPISSIEGALTDGSLDEAEWKKLKVQMYSDMEASMEGLELNEGCVNSLKKLQDFGFDLKIITARKKVIKVWML